MGFKFPTRTKDPARVLAGMKRQHTGKVFEQDILRSVRDAQGVIIELFRIENGVKYITGGRNIPVRSPFDFGGCVAGGGRGVFFDAKVTGEGDTVSMPLHRDECLKPQQAEHLYYLAKAGAIAGLLVKVAHLKEYRWLDAQHLRERLAMGWDDRRWVILGSATGLVPLRRLVEAYQ